MKQKEIQEKHGEIVIYQTPSGKTALEVKLQQETVWLNLTQMASLFKRDKSVISRHIKNVFESHELSKSSTVAFFATVQKEGKRVITREVEYFNLDMIISIGYRVNSIQGTRFRLWATKVLKDHLILGYSLNESRLKEARERFNSLQKAIKLMSEVSSRKELSSDETRALFDLVKDYSYALDVLDDYDHGRIGIKNTTSRATYKLTHHDAMDVIEKLKKSFGSSKLFGQEKDESFKSSIASIYQSFSGKDLYPSLEEKAAHLLYFIVKNHSFVDGNKRIAAALFLWFLEKNSFLYRADGTKRIADNALVALTLMIAESDPKDKAVVTALTVNLINRKN